MVHTFKYFFGTIPVGILGTQIIPGALVWQHCLEKSGFAKLPNNKRVWQHYLTKIVYDRPLASPLSDYNMCYQFCILRNLRIDIKDRLEEY